MNITLELSPELEARLRAHADQSNQPIESFIVQKLESLYPEATEAPKADLELDDFPFNSRDEIAQAIMRDEF